MVKTRAELYTYCSSHRPCRYADLMFVNNILNVQVKFLYELMIATACCCFVLAIILLWFILWVYCAVTRVTYLEQRRGYKFTTPDQGLYKKSE